MFEVDEAGDQGQPERSIILRSVFRVQVYLESESKLFLSRVQNSEFERKNTRECKLCVNMERAVDVLRDASVWLRSLPKGDINEKQEEGFSFKKDAPTTKPDAIWSKTKEPQIVVETDSFDKKKLKDKHDEFNFDKAREKLREKLESVLAFPSELKEKFQTKFLHDTAVKVDISEREETRSGKETDFDREYDIIELRENIFVIGGATEGNESEPSSAVGVFSCAERTWREIAPLPVKTTACYATEVTAIPALVVAGGFGGWKALNTVQMYDWVTKEWCILKPMRKRRWGCYATGTEHGILVAGGCDQGTVLSSVELYNVKKREWFTLPEMLEPRCNFGGGIIDRKLLVVGGGSGFYFNSAKNSAEIFDGEKGKWTKLPPMKRKRYGCAAVAWKRKLFVVGGCDKSGTDVLEVEAFDLEGHVWLNFPPLPVGYSLCRAKIVQNMLVAFGADGGENTAYAFDFELNRWEKYIELPQGRNAYAIGVIGI